MPQNETYLDLVITADGNVCCYDNEGVGVAKAFALPDHGDLIDREELLKKKMKMDAFVALEWVSDVDICLERTVIPAERSEDETN